MSVAPFVHFEVVGKIGKITLDRPDKLNALSFTAISELATICSQIERNRNIRAVVLSGKGRTFCAGGDIEEWSALSDVEFSGHWVRQGNIALDALARLRVPVIAALSGHTMGGGLELAACADVRVAEEQIKIALPETGLGVVPGWSGTQRTVRRFGAQAVRRLALLGEVFSAQDALDVGVVDYLVPAGKALEISFELAERASQRAPRATEIAKLMIGIAEGEEGRNAVDSLASVAVFGTDELAEGVGAFREKRKPDF